VQRNIALAASPANTTVIATAYPFATLEYINAVGMDMATLEQHQVPGPSPHWISRPDVSGPGNLLPGEEMGPAADMFLHSMEAVGQNHVNPASYYASPAAARAMHGYRPTSSKSPCLCPVLSL